MEYFFVLAKLFNKVILGLKKKIIESEILLVLNKWNLWKAGRRVFKVCFVMKNHISSVDITK